MQKLLILKTPRERYVLAMGEGSVFQGNVYVRGSPHKLGDPVHGRNLTALGGKSGSRLDLANQLTSANQSTIFITKNKKCKKLTQWTGQSGTEFHSKQSIFCKFYFFGNSKRLENNR